ncbi:hypothetical protein [Streptomyces sp. NPDC049744]|uniref:hypothetical protein n=1 Tax=Streptomyces sp. NPDC049744 TaxID=3154359 RepID=UPI00342364BD
MDHPSSPAEPEPFVVRDEMWEMLQRDPGLAQAVQTVKADAARRGLTTSELLTELARQGRRGPTAYERWMASEDAHRMGDFD